MDKIPHSESNGQDKTKYEMEKASKTKCGMEKASKTKCGMKKASKSENGDDIGIAKLVKEFDDVFQDKKLKIMNAEPMVIELK